MRYLDMKLSLTTTKNFSPMGAILHLVSLKIFFLLIDISGLFSKGKYKFLSMYSESISM